MRPEIKNR